MAQREEEEVVYNVKWEGEREGKRVGKKGTVGAGGWVHGRLGTTMGQ